MSDKHENERSAFITELAERNRHRKENLRRWHTGNEGEQTTPFPLKLLRIWCGDREWRQIAWRFGSKFPRVYICLRPLIFQSLAQIDRGEMQDEHRNDSSFSFNSDRRVYPT